MKLVLYNDWQKLYPDTVNSDIHTTYGVISKDVFNKTSSGIINTHKGTPLLIVEPNFKDLFYNMTRGPQIINFKDAPLIASVMGLRPGYKVGDAGGGSGAMTCFMANIVGEKGKVYSYEKIPKWSKLIESNVKLFGLKNVEIITKDIYTGISEKGFDAFNLDLPTPWEAIKVVESVLKIGGILTVYLPNTTQLSIMAEASKTSSLKLLDVIELIKREWIVDEKVCHPNFNMLGHTGFVMVYRKMEGL